jgi:hypothetical protein
MPVPSARGSEAQEVIVMWIDEMERRGRTAAILEQLQARFGAVPAEVRTRVQRAGRVTALRWAVQLLTAPSIEKALAPARAPRPAAARRAALARMEEIELRGRIEGRAKALLEQLRTRFGAVPAEARARVQSADEATLKRWAVRVLTAPSMEETLTRGRAPAAKQRPASRPRTTAR